MADSKNIGLLICAFMIIFLSSCGSTRIYSDDPQADIYMDDELVGHGETTVTSIGPPKTVILEAKKGNQVIGRTDMSRSFTVGTFFWGLFSYYTGWYWGWYYPDNVFIPNNVIQYNSEDYISPWDDPGNNIWMKPLNSPKK